MIDTDKYEGELEYRMNKEFCNDIACGDMNKDLAIQYAHEFYGNALELLAEVKGLHEQIQLLHDTWFVDEEMASDVDERMTTLLKEMIE